MQTLKLTRQMRYILPFLSLLALTIPAGATALCRPDQAGLKRAMAATLVVAGADRDRRFLGSAVLWNDGRFAVTAAHVVGERRRVRLRNAFGLEVIAEVVILDAARDVAFVKLAEAILGRGLALRRTELALGEPVFAIGAPFEADQTLTGGIISAKGRQIDPAVPVYLIQHDAAINVGSSGGALVDCDGNLLGINAELVRNSRFYAGLSYALPAALLEATFDGVLQDVPVIGLRLRPVDGMIAEALGIADRMGLLVDYVVPGSAADTAGIRAGDIILAIDGRAIQREGDFALFIDDRTGSQSDVTLMRGQDKFLVTLKFIIEGDSLISSGSYVLGAPTAALLNHVAPVPGKRCTSLKDLGVILRGRRVSELAPTSPAYLAGLSVGDEILAIDGVPVGDAGFVWPEIEGPVVLLVRGAGGQTRHVVFDPFSNEQGMRPIGGAVVLDPVVITL
ncbi:PDZ domain-containing protein [Marinovum sp. 2_MG-2023]|nr:MULTISPECIES: trypsin-like peptidase domain-containing protein [unclassified Marinovum]MDO6731334.1 PDZ domain-containing protein [Marinovum sp. 2_MG-2023]MDO6780767.1 PDZ domain-containing protein [Marinovum sp. 1_MG-2023]